MFQEGRRDGQGNKRAVGYFRAAAEQNHTQAQFALAVMYHHGYGVVVDIFEAVQWSTSTMLLFRSFFLQKYSIEVLSETSIQFSFLSCLVFEMNHFQVHVQQNRTMDLHCSISQFCSLKEMVLL